MMLITTNARATASVTPHEVGFVVGDAVEDQRSHAGDREDDLDHHGPAEQVADAQAEHGDGGDEGVAQHIAADHDHAGIPAPSAVRT